MWSGDCALASSMISLSHPHSLRPAKGNNVRRINGSGKYILISIAISTVLAQACSDNHAPKSSCMNSEAAVGAAAQRLVASDNDRDLAAVLAGYTDDVTWLPPNGDVLKGKDAIRPRYERMFSSFKINMTSEIVEARAEGDLGFARGFTTGTLTPLDGSSPTVVNDKFVALVRCEAGAWRVSHLMWSSRSPAP